VLTLRFDLAIRKSLKFSASPGGFFPIIKAKWEIFISSPAVQQKYVKKIKVESFSSIMSMLKEVNSPQTTTAILVYVKTSTANGIMNCSDIKKSE
jgi:hypothetical protein